MPLKYLGNHTLLDTFNLSSKPTPTPTTFITSIPKTPAEPTAPSSAAANTVATTGQWMDKRGSSRDNKVKKPSPSLTIGCNTPTDVGDPYTKTGGQRQISNVVGCDSTTNCQQSYAQSVTVTSSLTILKGTTIIVSAGLSISVEENRKIDSIESGKRCGLMENS